MKTKESELAAARMRSGALLFLCRDLGRHSKIGFGYDFTGFTGDLPDLRSGRICGMTRS